MEKRSSSNTKRTFQVAFRAGKVLFASSTAALATLLIGIVISMATDTEKWFGDLWSSHFPYMWGVLVLLWLPAMWKGLK
jgi:hypothetical protein